MILLLVLVVVVVAVAAAGLLGAGVLGGDSRGRRSGILAALSIPAVVLLGVVIVAVVVLGVARGGSGPEPAGEPAAEPAEEAAAEPASGPASTLPATPLGDHPAPLPVVAIRAAAEDRFSAYRPVTGLPPNGVVRVRAEGFGAFERARLEQCVSELGRTAACGPAFPVQLDEEGRADVQFALHGDIAPGGCRVAEPTCFLRLTGTESGQQGTAQVVMVDRYAAGHVTVSPARGLTDGDTVDVSATGFPAGTRATAVVCAPPGPYDARRCSPPEPGSAFAVDAKGSGRTTLTVAAGRVGPDGVLCGPQRACAVVVVVGPGFVAAPPAPIAFSSGPGVAYSPGRVAGGLAVAVVLLAVAAAIALGTDWTKPTEASTPALDHADLRADQDLDEIFGTDEELDERDPIPW